MKKSVIKGIVFGAVFLVSLVVLNRIMNRGNTDATVRMSPPSLPVVYMMEGDVPYNTMFGYTEEMEIPYMRDHITVLDENRETGIYIDAYGETIESVSYELRSIDGERLIEKETFTDLYSSGSGWRGTIRLKDLIEQNREYSLTVLIRKEGGSPVRYYTRVIWDPESEISERLEFVRDFHEKTFYKEQAKKLTKYLEPNEDGDNSTLRRVTIHSSFQQITWGNLKVRKESEPRINLTELNGDTANLTLDYIVSAGDDGRQRYFYVEEFYRIRYTEERTYLLDYERRMDEFFDETDFVCNENRILLGIADENMQFRESEDGKIVVFALNNKLCSYNMTTNTMSVLFCFYGKDSADYRTVCNHHKIKILDVQETGNVEFAVYGYMNSGRHEGKNGVQIYVYNSAEDTVEEELYIGYTRSFAVLQNEIDDLLYSNRDNLLYLRMNNGVYRIDSEEKKYERIEQSVLDGSLMISESNKMMVGLMGGDIYSGTELKLVNLNEGTELSVPARQGEYIMPLGFMGEDLIYGKAYAGDIRKDTTGRVFYPMYRVNIMDADGNVLKSYYQTDCYVTGCRIGKNQIILSRVKKDGDGEYENTADDYIANNESIYEGKNKLDVIVTENYEKQVQLVLDSGLKRKTLKVLYPQEVLIEGENRLALKEKENERDPQYYVYGLSGLQEIDSDPAKAVNAANALSGSVVNAEGNYVWRKGKLASRNQIMAIGEAEVTSKKDSVAVCLDTMLRYEGIIRNSEYLLNRGQTIYSVLEQNLEDAQVLDLRGCSLDSILYYINRDIPVFAGLSDGNAVLLIGFNDYNIVVMDPLSGTIYKKGMKDSTEWMEENGNCFLTYIR